MAASTDLKDYVDVLTKCPICLEDFVNPKSLPCLHTFCLQCIKDHCRDDSPGDQVNCPVCRSSFVIPVGGVEQLPNNFFLKGLSDAKKVSDKPAEIVPCMGCSDDSEETASSITPSTMICTGCGMNMCKQCSRPHGRIPGGGHEVVPLGSESQKEVLTSQGSYCSQHPGNRLEIYCIECSENMCLICSHGNKHRAHNTQFRLINEVYKEFRDTIERDIELVLEREKSIQREVTILKSEQQQANDDVIKHETELSQIAREIKRKVDEVVNQLRMRLTNEKTELSKVATDRNNQYEFELAEHQSFTRYSSELIKIGKPCDVTHAYKELHTRVGELLQREVKTDDYQLPTRTVSPDELFDGILDWLSTRSPNFRHNKLVIKELEKERDAVKDELLQLAAKYDVKLMKLEKEVIDTKAERDTAIQQQTSSNNKVKQLEKENNEIRRERDNVKEQLSKLKSDNNIKVKRLKQQKEDITHELNKHKNDHKLQVSQLETQRDHVTGEMTNQKREHDMKVKLLEKEKDNIRKECDAVEDQLSKLTTECDIKVNKLEREKTQLIETNKKQVKQLEELNDVIQHTKSSLRFLTTPEKVKLIHSMNEDKPIHGLTTLNNELFVSYIGNTDILFVRYFGNTDITIYDTETYSVQRRIQVPGLRGVKDMTSCKRHQCIYTADSVYHVVHRVNNENTITQWPVNDKPYGLSVNSVYNVLVTCAKVGKVKEFTTDGKLIREISLESSIVHPWHTVELTTGQLVVCHGNVNDAVHRVCIVDLSGRVLQSYGGSKGSGSGQLYKPTRLAVNGVIFVADRANHRVLMLSPTLSLIREVVSGLRYPMRLWFDDETGRLFVGDNKYENDKYVSGQVKVYGV